MAIRASALANTYLLPQQQQQAVAPKPQFQDEIGGPEEGLAQIDGSTAQYFDKWAALKGFARDVWENYGIDVRYPDPSVPESNRLHRIYLKSIADLKQQGAQLKTDQAMYNAMLQRGDQIKFDPTKQHASQMRPGTDFIPNELDAIVLQTNEKLRQQYYDSKSLNEAKKIYEDTKATFMENAKNDPQNAEYWNRQAQGLVPPTSAMKPFRPDYGSATERKDDAEIEAAGAFLKKIENNRTGNADHFRLNPKYIDENGDPMFVSTDMAGDKWSDTETIVRWEHSPTQDKTWLVVKDKENNINRVDVSAEDGMSVSKALTSNNARYASAGEKLDRYAQKYNLFKGEGGLDNSSLLVSDASQRYQRKLDEVGKSKTKEQVKQLGQELDTLEPGWFKFTDDSIEKVGSDGVPIKIIRRNNGFEIGNMDELVPPEEYQKYKKSGKIWGKQKVLNFLAKRGVVEQVESGTVESPQPQASGTKTDKPKTIKTTTLESLIGTKGYEGQTLESLIQYYKDNGYTIK